MNLKSLSLLLAAAWVGGVGVRAQSSGTPASSITVTPSFVSQYMFRGVRLGGPAFQPSAEFDQGGLALGVWANFPAANKVDGVSDPEVDPYGSYTFNINDHLSVSPGFTWYTYPDAEERAGFYQSTFEPSLAANCTIGGVRLTPKIYYDIVLDGPTYELTAAYAVALKDVGSELDFAATVGTYQWRDAAQDTTPVLKNWGDYWQVGVSAPFTVTANSRLTVGIAYAEGGNNYYKQGADHRAENTAAVGRAVVTVSYAYTF